jgi:hypothetical protein
MPFSLEERRRALEESARYPGLTGEALAEHMMRRSGRSTAFAMMIVAQALTFPNQPIKLKDHYTVNGATPRQVLRDTQLPLIRDILIKLDLRGMVLDPRNLTLTYRLL